MKPIHLLASLFAAVGIANAARSSTAPEPAMLIGHLRPALSRPGTFLPASLRFPLRLDPDADLKAARVAVEKDPDDIGARRRLAQLLEQVEDESAEAAWRDVVEKAEPEHRKKPADPAVLELLVEAMVGADLGVRVVPPAEKLRAAAPQRWQVQLLYGDARMRRADFNWRVCVRLGERAKSAPQFAEMLGDIEAAAAAYQRAVELAPGEPAVRGARISLAMARVFMAGFLPESNIAEANRVDTSAFQRELVDLCRRSVSRVASLWHTTHFLVTFGLQDRPLAPEDRTILQRALGEARAEQPTDEVFLNEARGMWAVAIRDWDAARKAFDAACAANPKRRFASAWLAHCDAHCGEPPAVVTDRIRSRLKIRESSDDYALLGAVLGESDRDSATTALRKAIELDVQNANARYNLGLLLLRRRPDSSDARYQLRQALELDPDNLEARLAQCVLLALAGNVQGANQALRGLRELPQSDPDLKGRIGALLETLGGLPRPAGAP